MQAKGELDAESRARDLIARIYQLTRLSSTVITTAAVFSKVLAFQSNFR